MRSMKIFLSLLLVAALLGCSDAKVDTAPSQTPETTAGKAVEQHANEIKALEEKQAQAEKAEEEMTKFTVTNPRFYKTEEEYLGKRQPRVEMTVRNGTQSTVSRAYFMGTLSSPDGSQVFLRQTFSHRFSKGLAPGEEKKEDFGLNMYSPWAEIDAPEDAILTVQVIQLEGSGEMALNPTATFSVKDAARLEELKKAAGEQ